MTRGLTKRQEAILQQLVDYVQRNGYPPSIREIGKEFGIGSLRGVTVHLDALQRKGYISRGNTPRSIRIIHPEFQANSRTTLLPLLGTIAAGAPITATENIEDLIPVPQQMVRNIAGAFLLRVKGDSMTGAAIMPRDLVVIKPQQTATHGDLVAILLGDEATVKWIHFDRGKTWLVPANPAYDRIEVQQEDARVIGKVVGLLRDYEGMAF
jgi:repressor LexA